MSPIQAENARTGDPAWNQGFSNSWAHQLEAYADRVSASAGDTVKVMVNVDARHTASWQLYRLGWYGGAGARKVLDGGTLLLAPQPACSNNTSTGFVKCAWAPSFTVQIPQGAVSGLFVIRILRDDAFGELVPLVVRDSRPADLLFQASVTTYQAYNPWGGESLYDDADGIAGAKAVQVSFDRPYAADYGTGNMLRYEALAARYLERYGYDVTYTTNLDVAREGVGTITKRGAFLSVGHDEYWPLEERDAVQAARDAGTPLLFLGANPAYWKVRLSDPGPDGNARTITCYKMFPDRDPLAGTPQATGRFRDAPFNRPEEALVGVMYESWLLLAHPWVVASQDSLLYEGTGLADGDALPNLVGYEYDRTFTGGTPGSVDVVARSPVVDAYGNPGFAESTLYYAPSRALVFGAGTIYWSFGLDGPLRDPRLERMTANLLKAAVYAPIPAALQTVIAPAQAAPRGAWATDVRTVAQGQGMLGPTGVAQLPDGTLVVVDARANRLWSVAASGAVSPLAGDGVATGNAWFDNVPALQARFWGPTAVVADKLGNLYVADTDNQAIRRIASDANRTVTTIAGAFGSPGFVNGALGTSRLSFPMGLAWLDAAQTKLLIADSNNHAIRLLDVTTKTLSTYAGGHPGDDVDGPAATATFVFPTAVTAAPDGRVFFIAPYVGKLKAIGTDAARTITTIAGGGTGFQDGPGTSARLSPQGGLVWSGGTLLVSDSANMRIRKVVPGTDAASTQVYTFAGSGRVSGVDGSAASASFGLPLGLVKGSDGNLYVADAGRISLRVIRP